MLGDDTRALNSSVYAYKYCYYDVVAFVVAAAKTNTNALAKRNGETGATARDACLPGGDADEGARNVVDYLACAPHVKTAEQRIICI